MQIANPWRGITIQTGKKKQKENSKQTGLKNDSNTQKRERKKKQHAPAVITELKEQKIKIKDDKKMTSFHILRIADISSAF